MKEHDEKIKELEQRIQLLETEVAILKRQQIAVSKTAAPATSLSNEQNKDTTTMEKSIFKSIHDLDHHTDMKEEKKQTNAPVLPNYGRFLLRAKENDFGKENQLEQTEMQNTVPDTRENKNNTNNQDWKNIKNNTNNQDWENIKNNINNQDWENIKNNINNQNLKNSKNNTNNQDLKKSWSYVTTSNNEDTSSKEDNSANAAPLGLEALIGKNIFGVLASILIFIALILFGSMFYIEAGEFGKTCILFLGSFAITIVGLLLYKKMENTFSLSIIGCGMGCFYLTFIVCNVFFHWLPDIPLYLCLFLWIMSMGYLCRKMDSQLLCAIGQCGLSLAVFLGISNVDGDAALWMSITVFFLAATFFYFRICQQTLWTTFHMLSHIASLVTLLIIGFYNYDFCHSTSELLDNGYLYLVISIVLFAFTLYLLFDSYKEICEEDELPQKMLVFSNLFATVFSFYFFAFISNDLLRTMASSYITEHFSAICILFFNLVTGVWVEYKYQKYNTTKHAYDFITGWWIPVFLFFSTICLFGLHLNAYCTLLFLCIPVFLYGVKKNNLVYSISGLCVFGIFILTDCKLPFLHLVGIVATIGYFLFFIKKYHIKNCNAFKLTCYLLLLFSSIICINDVRQTLTYFSISLDFTFCCFLVFCLASSLQIGALYSPLIQDWEEENEEHETLGQCISIINLLLLCLGTSLLYEDFSLFLYLILVVYTFVLCFMRLRNLLKRSGDTMHTGLWVGFKCTIYLYAVLKSTPIEKEIFFSIALLLIAILAILAGFWWKSKSLRVYGLGLTMISICKLILLDISYSNLMEAIVAFLFCGILCFVINYIYNRLSKRLLEE